MNIHKLALVSLAMLLSLNAQKFERPKQIDVSKYQSVCSRVLSSKANLGYFLDAIAEIPSDEDSKKRVEKGVTFFPDSASLHMFYAKRAEIERENEINQGTNRKYDKGAQYYIERYEELSSVFNIKLINKGMKNTNDPQKVYCLYEVTYTPKQKLDIKKFTYFTARNPVSEKMPSVAELTDKDFNTLSNLAGYSLARLRSDDRDVISYLVRRYFLIKKDQEGYEYSSNPWGKDVKLKIDKAELEWMLKNPQEIDLPY